MINAVYGSTIKAYVTTEEKRFNTSVASSKIRYLFKFTNDMTKAVKYAYGQNQSVKDRYTYVDFPHNTTENVFTGAINFKPYGFWSYEIYEVSWVGTPSLNSTNAPDLETETLATADANGVVQGKVEGGKVYITETSGSEQIKYTEHTESTTNYLYAN